VAPDTELDQRAGRHLHALACERSGSIGAQDGDASVPGEHQVTQRGADPLPADEKIVGAGQRDDALTDDPLEFRGIADVAAGLAQHRQDAAAGGIGEGFVHFRHRTRL